MPHSITSHLGQVICAIALLLNVVCWWLLYHFVRRLPSPWRPVLRAGLTAFFLFQMLGLCWISLPRFVHDWHHALSMPGRFLPSLVYLWNLVSLPILSALLLLVGAIRLALRWGARLWRKIRFVPEPERPADLGRRQFLFRSGAAMLPALSTLGMTVTAYLQLPFFRTRFLDVPIPDLPPELDGLRIAHLSDFHAGRFIDADYLGRIVDTVNALEPDLIAFTGDLIDYSVSDMPLCIDVLRRLRSRHGLWICEGNHDLYDDAQAFHRAAQESGLNFLLNESRVIDVRGVRLQLIGLRWEGHPIPRPIPWDASAFPILLAHHPHHFDNAVLNGIPLTLSGHTHGGQLMLTDSIGCGPLFFKYWSGLYSQGSARLVVSNGAGNWFPLRINAPAEIGLLTLRRT